MQDRKRKREPKLKPIPRHIWVRAFTSIEYPDLDVSQLIGVYTDSETDEACEGWIRADNGEFIHVERITVSTQRARKRIWVRKGDYEEYLGIDASKLTDIKIDPKSGLICEGNWRTKNGEEIRVEFISVSAIGGRKRSHHDYLENKQLYFEIINAIVPVDSLPASDQGCFIKTISKEAYSSLGDISARIRNKFGVARSTINNDYRIEINLSLYKAWLRDNGWLPAAIVMHEEVLLTGQVSTVDLMPSQLDSPNTTDIDTAPEQPTSSLPNSPDFFALGENAFSFFSLASRELSPPVLIESEKSEALTFDDSFESSIVYNNSK